mmetsp:Transcript_68763/g.191551  ORF Transcript_68763/g.191551 Transcript_68763/m.191551 type:complete len:218 (+) Transcript_68763:309-962(+)
MHQLDVRHERVIRHAFQCQHDFERFAATPDWNVGGNPCATIVAEPAIPHARAGDGGEIPVRMALARRGRVHFAHGEDIQFLCFAGGPRAGHTGDQARASIADGAGGVLPIDEVHFGSVNPRQLSRLGRFQTNPTQGGPAHTRHECVFVRVRDRRQMPAELLARCLRIVPVHHCLQRPVTGAVFAFPQRRRIVGHVHRCAIPAHATRRGTVFHNGSVA